MALTFAPVKLVDSGGIPVVVVTNGYGTPFTVMPTDFAYATPITVGAEGMPVLLYNPDGSPNSGDGYTFTNSEAAALVARFTTPATVSRKGLIDNLVGSLKTAGVWSKLDVLYVRAAADNQAARVNWVAAAYDSTAFSSPVFTVDRGFTPDGAASYLTSGFDPTTAVAPKLTQDNGHLGGWHLTDLTGVGATNSFDLGNTTARIGNNPTAATLVRANTSTNTTVTEDYAKHKLYTRDGASSWRYYNDGALVGADPRTDASSAMTAFSLGTGRTAATSFGNNQEAVAHWGAHLTSAEVLGARNAFATYLAAVGAI